MTADLPTLSVTELAAISIDNRFTRIAEALEKIADAAERIADSAPNSARIGDSLELLTALLASTVGVGISTCHPAESTGQATTQPINFIRTGDGRKSFTCDATNADDRDG